MQQLTARIILQELIITKAAAVTQARGHNNNATKCLRVIAKDNLDKPGAAGQTKLLTEFMKSRDKHSRLYKDIGTWYLGENRVRELLIIFQDNSSLTLSSQPISFLPSLECPHHHLELKSSPTVEVDLWLELSGRWELVGTRRNVLPSFIMEKADKTRRYRSEILPKYKLLA